MRKKFYLIIAILFLFIFNCTKASNLKEDGIYAEFVTNNGSFICQLFYKKTPVTVGNFVGLAEGNKEFKDPESGEMVKERYYKDLIFHRVIKNFVIQGGCPLGDGTGGPGYTFIDEIDPELKHDSAGILSMANRGSDTNGSQFFITLAPTPHLDGRHTVFGKVVEGMDVIEELGNVKTDKNDKPYDDIFIKDIYIRRVGSEAKRFSAIEAFNKMDDIIKKQEEEKAKKAKEFMESLNIPEDKLVTNDIGLQYYVREEGTGEKPEKGDTIVAHYSGYLEDGTKFDSSYDRKQPIEIPIGVGRVIPGWDEAFLSMKEGEERVLILPHYLGYGERGYPPVIPPKAKLIFEVKLIEVKDK